MPGPTALTRNELKARTRQAITDPYNSQNTATLVRAVFELLIDATPNPADDGLPTGTPGAASYATITGSPFDSVPLAAALRRAPNLRPGGPFQARFLTDAQRGPNLANGITAETLLRERPELFYLGAFIRVEFSPTGPLWQNHYLEFDGATRTPATSGLRVYRTADMVPGDLINARLVAEADRRGLVYWGAIDPNTFHWRTNAYTSIYLGSPATERLFRYVGPDDQTAPAPTGTSTDAGKWVSVTVDQVPLVIPLATATTAGSIRLGKGLRAGNAATGVVQTTAVDYVTETYHTYDPQNGVVGSPGQAYALTDFPQFFLAFPLAGQVGRLVSVRNQSATQATQVICTDPATSTDYDVGTLPPGYTGWFKYTDMGYEPVLYTAAVPSVDFDPYEVSLAIRQAVVDGFDAQDTAGNTSPFLQGTQPAGSRVGMEFIDPQQEFLYKFRPVAFANGTANVWCSGLLSR